MTKIRTIILTLTLAALATSASAQVFTGEHKYDGEHKNEPFPDTYFTFPVKQLTNKE